MATVSKFDVDTMPLAREHINQFIIKTANRLSNIKEGRLLEIGPQERSTVRLRFSNFKVETFDIVKTYSPDHVGDITRTNVNIADSSYDVVACLEVLEHTLNPFAAIRELRRILKPGGFLLLSAPLNWRIHGPIPDCWRITEHGFKVLLRDFDNVEIESLETPGRDLFPIHYNALGQCNKTKQTNDGELTFRFIT
jgi:SAM-dependent methyltransferase